MGLLEDSGEFRCAVITDAEGGDVTQDVCDQLYIVVLHCLQPQVLQSLVGLQGSEVKGYGVTYCTYMGGSCTMVDSHCCVWLRSLAIV